MNDLPTGNRPLDRNLVYNNYLEVIMGSKFALISDVAITDQRLTAMQVRVLCLVGYYGGNKPNGCWPSYEKMASELKTTRRAIIGYINHLCECGYIIKEPRKRENGSDTTNILRIILDQYGDEQGVTLGHPGVIISDTPRSDKNDHPHKEPYKLEPEKENKVKINKKSSLITLQEWEAAQGCALNGSMISSWCREKGLYHPTITRLLEEFRIEMMSKGKQYADFKAAFQTYLTKGYLSLTLAGAQATSKREASALDSTTVNRRGGDI